MRLLAILFVTLVALAGCSKSSDAPTSSAPAKYHCPMHPTVVSDKPGDCPICGMKLVPIAGEHAGHEEMEMTGNSGVPGLATVTITPSARERMGLTFGTVEKRPLAREIRTSARIVPDESRLYLVSVKFEGWVDKLFVAVTGQAVKKGEPLLTVYSPELVSAQEEYLLAAGNESLQRAARRRLELWDISDAQIEQLEKSGQTEKNLTLYAPADGVVLDRMVLPGQKIMPNDALMVIGDLSVVWADADLYQSDLPFVKEGMPVEFDAGGQEFAGKVTFITPTLDPMTRTAKARLEIPNPNLLLKPELYGTARLFAELGERLAIPEAAVMRAAEHTYAFKVGENDQLIPVHVTLGARSDGRFEVLDGLSEGERVVTSANFLVDSESSMKAALAGLSGAGAHQH
jgi:RND family efflux transporter MFP subunit